MNICSSTACRESHPSTQSRRRQPSTERRESCHSTERRGRQPSTAVRQEPEVHASVPQWSESSRYWEDSGSHVSEPQWSERNDEETSKGWRTWNIREEGRTSAYPQRAQSSTDVWIPRDDDEDVWNSTKGWNSRDEGTYVWIPKQVGTYVWIPKETGETAKKKSRRGKPRSRPCAADRISAREKRVQEARDRLASPAEPSEVAKASSPAAGDEGSLSRS